MDKKNIRTIIIALIIMILPVIYAVVVKGKTARGSGTLIVVGALIIAGLIEVIRDIQNHKEEYKERYEKEQAVKNGTYVEKPKNNAKREAKKAYEAELNRKRNEKKKPKKLN